MKPLKTLAFSMVLCYNSIMETAPYITETEREIQALKALVAELTAQNHELKILLKHYEERLLLARMHRFGPSSEKTPGQLHFEGIFNEAEEQADSTLPEPTYEQVIYKRKKRVGKRGEDLSRLPKERVEYELPEEERVCPECGELMRDIGVTTRDELVIIPAKVIRKEHVVHAYACANCEKQSDHTPIVRAQAPAPLIGNSLATSSAVAHIAVQKYVNGVPLYRQEKGLSYDNVMLSRQTMANWLIYCAEKFLAAIYFLLVRFLRMETVIHGDETTFQVLHEPGRAAQTKSFAWLYRTGRGSERHIVIFDYQETRKREHPLSFLKDFKGYLHADGYEVYHGLPPDITVVGCWYHARSYWRKLYDTIAADKRDGSIAERGLVYINLLFAYEEEYHDMTPAERYAKRLERSKPVSDDFFAWVGSLSALPKSLLGEAIHYALSQRKYLENVYLDGRLELSNNRAERSIRPFAQGRKQWLFANTPNGAKASAIFYSLIETAKANDLHPFHYLRHLLDTLPAMTTKDLESLLPWSEHLPDFCRAPKNATLDKPPRKTKEKAPLHKALLLLREKFERHRETPESAP